MFADRDDAARQLSKKLQTFGGGNTIVMGLARGGVVLAYRIARLIGASLGVLIVRKLGAPFNPELAIGAICGGGNPHVYLNTELIEDMGISDQHVDRAIQNQSQELRRREAEYGKYLPAHDLRDKTVIITDDGIATGATVHVAIEWVKRSGPSECVLAVPVASPRALRDLETMADRLVCLHSPDSFYAVGQFYRDFAQVSDEEVIDLLRRFARHDKVPA